jgi:hypothetical protein
MTLLDSNMIGSALSLRATLRLGSTVSIFHSARFGSNMSVIDTL